MNWVSECCEVELKKWETWAGDKYYTCAHCKKVSMPVREIPNTINDEENL